MDKKWPTSGTKKKSIPNLLNSFFVIKLKKKSIHQIIHTFIKFWLFVKVGVYINIKNQDLKKYITFYIRSLSFFIEGDRIFTNFTVFRSQCVMCVIHSFSCLTFVYFDVSVITLDNRTLKNAPVLIHLFTVITSQLEQKISYNLIRDSYLLINSLLSLAYF